MPRVEQLSFDVMEAPRRATDRLFFAIYPDAGTARDLALRSLQLRALHRITGTAIAPERMHITLHHIGDFAGLPQDKVDMALRAGQEIRATPFEVLFDQATSFSGKPGNRPFVLLGDEGLAQLRAFQQALGFAMARAGLAASVEKNFTPHLTLAYDGQAVGNHPISPVTWTAGEFALVHSLIGQTRHISLARWPLAGLQV